VTREDPDLIKICLTQQTDQHCRVIRHISKEELLHLMLDMALLTHLIHLQCLQLIIQEENLTSLITTENKKIELADNCNIKEKRRLITMELWF
jgi:hypothetical protein